MAPIEEGYWYPITSTISWCEKNYEVTIYVAEFWNTISNLLMIILPFFGLNDALKYNFEKRFQLMYGLLLSCGLGSWMFHMTLKYRFQLMDELPMVWGSAVMIYIVWTINNVHNRNYFLGLLLFAYCFSFTVVYTGDFGNPLVFQVLYGILVVILVIVEIYLVYKMAPYDSKGIMLLKESIIIYGLGFLLWNIDNNYCDTLTDLRNRTLPSWSKPIFQLHAWWHILAGYSTYQVIICGLYYRLRLTGKNPIVKWSFYRGHFVIPSISEKSN